MAVLLTGWGHSCHLPRLRPRGRLSLSELFDWGGICNSFPLFARRDMDTSARATELASCCFPFFSACFAEHGTVSLSFGLYGVVTGLWLEVRKRTSLSEVGFLKETLLHQFTLGSVPILKVHGCKS